MIENHSMDRLVKDVLIMELVMHTEKNDTMFHAEKTGMLMLVVETDVGGMTADVVDKLTCSSDDVQPKQVDLRCAHALTELHWRDIHVVPDRHEVDQHIHIVQEQWKSQEKVLVIIALKETLSKLKGKAVVNEAGTLHPIDPETAHTNYLRHTQEEMATLREIVESKRLLNLLNTSLDYA
nr:hypothetical protein [Tanacetum cinerariifolium]